MKPLMLLSYFSQLCERIFIETHSTESRCYRSEKYSACRRVRAFFSPDILQTGAVKGLIFYFLFFFDLAEGRTLFQIIKGQSWGVCVWGGGGGQAVRQWPCSCALPANLRRPFPTTLCNFCTRATTGGASERRDGAQYGFSLRIETILN